MTYFFLYAYGFRVGSRDYPTSIQGPYATLETAREAAYQERAMGRPTGHVRKVTAAQLKAAQAQLRKGILSSGW